MTGLATEAAGDPAATVDLLAAAATVAWPPDPSTGRWLRAFAFAAVIACGVATCARSHHPAPAARRIVAVGGAVTEIVFALGAGDRVVAVDSSSVYPDAATHLPQVGYHRTLIAEAVLAVTPDLVIASAEAGPPAALDQLRAAGVTVVVVAQALTVEAAAVRVEAVGAALREATRAHALADQVRREVLAIRARCCAGGGTPPRAVVIYARGAGTTMIAGGGTTGAAIVELAGARNAAGGFTGYKPLSPEVLVDAAPDVIVVPSRGLATLGGEAGLLALPGVAATPAGRARRFVAIDDLLLLGFGPRLPAAIDELARQMAAIPGLRDARARGGG
jgi:iron complex transport system substrate-binding protein